MQALAKTIAQLAGGLLLVALVYYLTFVICYVFSVDVNPWVFTVIFFAMIFAAVYLIKMARKDREK